MPGRSFDALQRSLTRGEVRPVYYFFGDEELLKDDAVRDLLGIALEEPTRAFNLDRRRAPETAADEFRSLVETPPMLAARRAVVLSEVESLLQKRARQQALRAAVLGYLKRPLPETLLVLVQSAGTKPDPELQRDTVAVDFEVLEPARVVRWIHHHAAKTRGVSFEDDAARLLQEAVGDDLSQIAAEVAKLAGAAGTRPVTAADVAELVGVRHEETIGAFLDAVTGRRFAAAAEMVPRLLTTPGASGVRLLGALGTSLVALGLARTYLDGGDSPSAAISRVFDALREARPVGLRNWREEAARWVGDAARWSAEEVEAGLAAALRADARLKSTTVAGEAEIVTEMVLSLGVPERSAA
jgi:DNA polymerase III subunit delta